MAGNTFGKAFAVTTFGESHGPAIGCVIDGCPPGVAVAEADFSADLLRRATGRSRHTSQRRENDQVEILSGVYEGRSTGTPIALLIRNSDARSADYAALANVFRPGHADYVYWQKYGIRDPRGGGRASARETTMRVAAAVIAKKILSAQGVSVRGYLAQLGERIPERFHWEDVEQNPFFWPDGAAVAQLEDYLDGIRQARDSVGARVNVVADGVPPGWGEPLYGKLDAELAAALMGINAVKGVEVGDGFAAVAQTGSTHRDAMTPGGFLSNHAGGILGGISTGQAVRVSLAFKPTSSIPQPVDSIDESGQPVSVTVKGRHDPCVGIRAVPIAEAMVALVLVDQFLRHRAQCAGVGAVHPRIAP